MPDVELLGDIKDALTEFRRLAKKGFAGEEGLRNYHAFKGLLSDSEESHDDDSHQKLMDLLNSITVACTMPYEKEEKKSKEEEEEEEKAKATQVDLEEKAKPTQVDLEEKAKATQVDLEAKLVLEQRREELVLEQRREELVLEQRREELVSKRELLREQAVAKREEAAHQRAVEIKAQEIRAKQGEMLWTTISSLSEVCTTDAKIRLATIRVRSPISPMVRMAALSSPAVSPVRCPIVRRAPLLELPPIQPEVLQSDRGSPPEVYRQRQEPAAPEPAAPEPAALEPAAPENQVEHLTINNFGEMDLQGNWWIPY